MSRSWRRTAKHCRNVTTVCFALFITEINSFSYLYPHLNSTLTLKLISFTNHFILCLFKHTISAFPTCHPSKIHYRLSSTNIVFPLLYGYLVLTQCLGISILYMVDFYGHSKSSSLSSSLFHRYFLITCTYLSYVYLLFNILFRVKQLLLFIMNKSGYK